MAEVGHVGSLDFEVATLYPVIRISEEIFGGGILIAVPVTCCIAIMVPTMRPRQDFGRPRHCRLWIDTHLQASAVLHLTNMNLHIY
jgi:hypothetical protein